MSGLGDMASRQGDHYGMWHFVDDDADYLQWLRTEPSGFVLNSYRVPSAAYLVLHRTSCKTISKLSGRAATLTGEYSKVCGTREDLVNFAGGLGGKARPCRLCMRDFAVLSRGGGRYGPLRDFLADRSDNLATMTFSDIEALVGQLPASARLHRAWWANGTNAEARAWRDAGWRVQSVDQESEHVVFGRVTGVPVNDVSDPAGNTYIDDSVAQSVVARAQGLGLHTAKLRCLIEELNDNYGRGNTYAAHALLRALLDHIPPLLDCRDFQHLVNNYVGEAATQATHGSSSFQVAG